MYELKIKKNNIRAQYLKRRKALPQEFHENSDAKIRALFMSLVTYRYADIILMYVPTRGEINILPVAEHALQNGKRVAFPCCDADTRTMCFRVVKSMDELRDNGLFGIPEPISDCPLYKNDAGNAVCVVPAIVYDKNGYRLGYGKGYYDRYLPAFKGTTVGLVYNDFTVSEVPRGRYDLAVDVLITEKGVRALASGK